MRYENLKRDRGLKHTSFSSSRHTEAITGEDPTVFEAIRNDAAARFLAFAHQAKIGKPKRGPDSAIGPQSTNKGTFSNEKLDFFPTKTIVLSSALLLLSLCSGKLAHAGLPIPIIFPYEGIRRTTEKKPLRGKHGNLQRKSEWTGQASVILRGRLRTRAINLPNLASVAKSQS